MAGEISGRHPRETQPTEDEARLLALLSSGVTDEVAAARLGWNARTLRRRLKRVMEKLGAGSRFQAGFLVCRYGWLARHPGEGGSDRRFRTGGGAAFGHLHTGL